MQRSSTLQVTGTAHDPCGVRGLTGQWAKQEGPQPSLWPHTLLQEPPQPRCRAELLQGGGPRPRPAEALPALSGGAWSALARPE